MGKTSDRVHLCTNENTDEIEALIGKKTLPGIFFKIFHQKKLKCGIEISYLFTQHGTSHKYAE